MARRRESGISSLAVLVLRAVMGSLLAGHGAQKLFGSFNGPGLQNTSAWMESLGLRRPQEQPDSLPPQTGGPARRGGG